MMPAAAARHLLSPPQLDWRSAAAGGVSTDDFSFPRHLDVHLHGKRQDAWVDAVLDDRQLRQSLQGRTEVQDKQVTLVTQPQVR